MQGLQRQYCYQSAKIQRKSKQSNKQQNMTKNKNKNHSIKIKTSLNGLLHFRKRKCKTPLKQHTEIVEEIAKTEQIEQLDNFEEKIHRIKCVRRHTYYVPNPKDERDKVQKTSNLIFLHQKMKARVVSQQTMYSQQLNKSKSAWKFKEKASKTEEHAQNREKQKQHSNTVKKFKKMNETAFTMLTSGEQNTFLSLIKKFRFQNLKNTVIRQSLESSFSKNQSKKNQNRYKSYNPFKAEKHEDKQRQQESHKANIYNRTQLYESKINRKNDKLTPWEITDQIYFLG